MGQFKSLYRPSGYISDFVYSYRVCVYDREYNFDTEQEARNFVNECQNEGMEVDLFEVEREDLAFERGDVYDHVSSDETETLITC